VIRKIKLIKKRYKKDIQKTAPQKKPLIGGKRWETASDMTDIVHPASYSSPQHPPKHLPRHPRNAPRSGEGEGADRLPQPLRQFWNRHRRQTMKDLCCTSTLYGWADICASMNNCNITSPAGWDRACMAYLPNGQETQPQNEIGCAPVQ
jgi:hypothetical protein